MSKNRFRGLLISKKKWVYGFYVESEGKSYIYPEKKLESPAGYEIESETLGQFTGTSRWKRELWEGDLYELKMIGSVTHLEFMNAIVKYNEEVGGFGFYVYSEHSDYDWIALKNSEIIMAARFIGNIHDNKKEL